MKRPRNILAKNDDPIRLFIISEATKEPVDMLQVLPNDTTLIVVEGTRFVVYWNMEEETLRIITNNDKLNNIECQDITGGKDYTVELTSK